MSMSAPNACPSVLIEVVLDRHTTKDVLCAILHSILFHRLFGTVKPRTVEVLDVTMPAVDDVEMERLVEEKVDAFWRAIESGPAKRGQIKVIFSEKRQRKSWFYTEEEEVPWEQWVVIVEVRQPKTDHDRQGFYTDLSSTLSKSLYTMLFYTSSERGRTAVPVITSASGLSPFPIKMVVQVGGVEIG